MKNLQTIKLTGKTMVLMAAVLHNTVLELKIFVWNISSSEQIKEGYIFITKSYIKVCINRSIIWKCIILVNILDGKVILFQVRKIDTK